MLLVAVLVGSFKMVHTTDSSRAIARSAASSLKGDASIPTPVVPQAAVVIEAKSPPVVPRPAIADQSVIGEISKVAVNRSEQAPETDEQVWAEINEAISGLNELVGAEMFLDVGRKQKGQMEIRLDSNLWNRVRYQTRVDLKTDISNLWHLYVKEYGYSGSSVVYFMDGSNDRVIDIFSRAN